MIARCFRDFGIPPYKYINKLLYDIIVFTCIVKVRKIELLKLRPAAPRP